MSADDARIFRDFQAYLDTMTEGLKAVRRWAHYRNDSPENGLEHAFKGTVLAMTMLALERAHGDAKGPRW